MLYTAEGLRDIYKYPFSDQAADVVNSAEKEARWLNSEYLGTEHLLLGLTRNKVPPLESLGVTLTRVRNAVEYIVGREDRKILSDIGFTSQAHRMIDLSIDEARKFGDRSLLPDHLLLGLCRKGEETVVSVLESLGVSIDQLQNQVRRNLIEPIVRTTSILDRLRTFFLDPNQDAAVKYQIEMILQGTVGLIPPQTKQNP